MLAAVFAVFVLVADPSAPMSLKPESVFEVAAHLAEHCEIEVKIRGRAALPGDTCQRALKMTETPEWESAYSCKTDRCAELAERYTEALGRVILMTR